MKKHLLILLWLISISVFSQTTQFNYYTMMQYGGANDHGTILAFDQLTGKDSVMHTFSYAGTDGENPQGSFIQGTDGLLYGMTTLGGTSKIGIVFSFDIMTLQDSVLFNFNNNNGNQPGGNLLQASNGLMYGMTYGGGTNYKGVLFCFNPLNGRDSVLLNFNVTNGSAPLGSLIQGSDGLLYGLTQGGGTHNYGVLFSYDPVTGKDSIRVSFIGTARNADNPEFSLVQASNGVMYGTSESGGSAAEGTVFSYNPANGTEDSLIINFIGTNGTYPDCTLLQANDGLLYGSAVEGGTHNAGLIFSLNPANNKDSIRFSFSAATGQAPESKLIQDSVNGLLYGLTNYGGTYGYGVIYSFNLVNNTYKDIINLQRYVNGAYPSGSFVHIHRTPIVAHITASPTRLCAGSSVQFKDSSTTKPTNWAWTFPGGIPSTSKARNPLVTYSKPGIYTVKMTVLNTTDIDSITKVNYITVLPNPTITLDSITRVACRGDSNGAVSITASSTAPYSYLWSNTNTNSTINNIKQGAYTITVTDSNKCKSADSIFIGTVPFIVTITSKSVICRGTNDTISLIGPIRYNWNTGDTTNTIIVAPVLTQTYSVTMKNATCTLDTIVTVRVDTMPNFNVTNKDTICAGTKDTLIASGATKYLWSTGDTTSTVIVIPLINATYTVTGKKGACTRDTSVTVDVKPSPHITITGHDTICNGITDTITVQGGTNYLWSTGDTMSSIIVTPSISNTYTITASIGTCNHDTSFTLTVTPLPVITVSGKPAICKGSKDSLVASGGTTYLWNNNNTSHIIVVSPDSATTYTVTAFKAGCSADTIFRVNTDTLKPIVITGKNQICKGTIDTISVTGGTKYIWNNGDTTNSVFLSPTGNTTYSITIKNGACVKDTIYAVAVDNNPIIKITGVTTLCSGIQDTLTATGGTVYNWSTGATTSVVIVIPAKDTTYIVTGYSGICKTDTSISLAVLPSPTLIVTGDSTICQGNSTKLKTTGASSYLWVPFSGINCYTCANVIANPSATTTYTIQGSKGSCTNTATTTIWVLPNNGFDLMGNLQICVDTPNFSNASIQACIYNNSCHITSGTLKLVFDTAFHITNSIVDSMAHISGDTLIWNYDSLSDIGKAYCIALNGHISNIPIGDSAFVSMLITPTVGDSNPANNNITYWVKAQPHNCIGLPFDPNEKNVLPVGDIDNTQKLTYTIHFQNTGTATARNVIVIDTLSANLDATTLKTISASNDVSTQIVSGHIVKFIFDNINLPDTGTSKTTSIGLFTYTVKPLAGLSPGDQIINRAGIYFDSNPVITTNKTVNTIAGAAPLGIANIATLNMACFPNPFTNSTSVVFNKAGQHYLELYDAVGRKIETITCVGTQYELQRGSLASGIYFIKAFNQDNSSFATNKIVIE